MKRTVYDELLKWKESRDRKPLLIKGVRQCGKTYILKEFGKENYEDVAYFTFEKNPVLFEIFQNDLDPAKILDGLSIMRKKKIEPGRTLLILDEIQLCGRALNSLKFFCEDAPEYHVACAGSLLGIMISKKNSFPVGKVNRIMMFPMSFKEYLLANSEDLLVEFVDNNDKIDDESLSAPAVTKLITHLDNYMIIGGMPAAVNSWLTDRDIEKVEKILNEIIEDYKDDFSKHAPELLPKLTLIWNSVPIQLAKDNNKFVFSHVKTGARSKDLEDALEWLVNAGLVYKVKKVDPPKVPLGMYADNMNFKIYVADIGILRKMAKMPPNFIFSKNIEYKDFRGAIAENYVLNEIISSTGDLPYYWRSGSDAEMDFVAQIDGAAVPIEAKAGNTKSKSLKQYIEDNGPKAAVITTNRRTNSTVVTYVPRYALWKMTDLVRKKIGGPEWPQAHIDPELSYKNDDAPFDGDENDE